jgi:hypothetical protein
MMALSTLESEGIRCVGPFDWSRKLFDFWFILVGFEVGQGRLVNGFMR